MSEEKNEKEVLKEMADKLAELIRKMTGEDVDKESDKLIEALREFSDATEKFTDSLHGISKGFKSMIDLSVIVDVKFAGDSKICVVGGSRKNILERFKELVEQVSGVKKDDND